LKEPVIELENFIPPGVTVYQKLSKSPSTTVSPVSLLLPATLLHQVVGVWSPEKFFGHFPPLVIQEENSPRYLGKE